MKTSEPTLATGGSPASPSANNGTSPPAGHASRATGTTSGSGSAAPATKEPSAQSSTSPESPSRGRPHKRTIARAKTTIAIALEQIDSQLLLLDQADKMIALVEIIRRMTRRLETCGVKIIEQLTPRD